MEKRTVIRVRYRNKSGTLSRPHKIQKILFKDNVIKYFNMNRKWEIDPTTFVTTWNFKQKKCKPTKQEAIREVIRVRFFKWEFDAITKKLGRPTKVYKYILNGKIEYKEYTTKGKYGKIIDPTIFTTDWVSGPTPTPKPSRKYTKEQLKKFGYSDELIEKIHRNWSAKTVELLCKKCGKDNLTLEKSRKLYEKYENTHDIVTNEPEIAKFITKHKADEKEAKKHVVHMGKHTHKKRKINYKPNSRRGRKMAKKGLPQYKDDQKLVNQTKQHNKKQQSKSQKFKERRG